MFRWRLSRPERALRGAELFCDVQFPDKPGRSAGTVQQLPVAGHQKAYFFRGIIQQFQPETGKAQTAEVLRKPAPVWARPLNSVFRHPASASRG